MAGHYMHDKLWLIIRSALAFRLANRAHRVVVGSLNIVDCFTAPSCNL